MSDLKLNESGDLTIEFSNRKVKDLVLVGSTAAIGQRLRIKLRHFLGEWYLDTSFGVPYFEEVFVKNPPQHELEATFKDAILSTPGISVLDSFSLDFNTADRKLSVVHRSYGFRRTIVSMRLPSPWRVM